MTERMKECAAGIEYRDRQWTVLADFGDSLFHPDSVGLHPVGPNTANGSPYEMAFVVYDTSFHADYVIEDMALLLKTLSVFIAKSDYPDDWPPQPENLPHVDSRLPVVEPPSWGLMASACLRYSDLALWVPLTGGLLLGTGRIDIRDAWCTNPALYYEAVCELTLDDGIVMEEIDHSEAMAKLRKRLPELGIREQFDLVNEKLSKDYKVDLW